MPLFLLFGPCPRSVVRTASAFLTEKYAIYRLPLKMVGRYLIGTGMSGTYLGRDGRALGDSRLSLSRYLTYLTGSSRGVVVDMHVP